MLLLLGALLPGAQVNQINCTNSKLRMFSVKVGTQPHTHGHVLALKISNPTVGICAPYFLNAHVKLCIFCWNLKVFNVDFLAWVHHKKWIALQRCNFGLGFVNVPFALLPVEKVLGTFGNSFGCVTRSRLCCACDCAESASCAAPFEGLSLELRLRVNGLKLICNQ